MAHSRTFPRRQFRTSTKRGTVWDAGPSASGQTVTAAGTNVIWSTGIAPTADGLTIVRIRGQLQLMLRAAAAVTDRCDLAIGIGMVSDQAFASVATAIPGPFDEVSWPGWMYHQFASIAPSQTDAGGVLLGRDAGHFRVDIDTKAMRKFPIGLVIFGAIEMGFETGSVTVGIHARTRMLAKLS